MVAFLGALAVLLGRLFIWLLPFLIHKLFILLGVSYVTYKGISVLTDKFTTIILNNFQQYSSTDFALRSLAMIKFDVVVSILLSAIAIKMSFKFASSLKILK